MRAFRLPAVLVFVALLIAAAGFERRVTPVVAEPGLAELARTMPTAAAAGALSSTWFCASGTARGSAAAPDPKAPDAATAIVAEQTVVIANQADHALQVRVTAYPSEGAPVARVQELAAGARADVVVSDLVKAPFASALVEADGGLVGVTHRLSGPTGETVGPCASSASDDWYFPAGTTRLGTRQLFAVFNPFPDQAVLDLTFQVEDEGGRQTLRDSDKLKGVVIPAGKVTMIDITDTIAVRPQVATHISVRRGLGRVVIDQLLVDDGAHDGPKRLSATLGAPSPQGTWVFADGEPLGPGVDTTFVLYNPGTDTVEADVLINIDGGGPDIEPYGVTVRAGQYATVSLSQDNRVPAGVGYWAVAESRRGGPIVVGRVTTVAAPATRPGVDLTLGSPLLANQWIVPLGGTDAAAGLVSVANLSAVDDVTITVSAVTSGAVTPLDRYNQVTLPAGARTVVELTDPTLPGGATERSVRVDANGPVVTEQSFAWTTPAARADLVAIPVHDTIVQPSIDLGDHVKSGDDVTVTPGDIGTLPVVPPSDLPGGSVPGSTPGSLPGDAGAVPPASDPTVPVDPTVPDPSATTTVTPGPADAVTTTVGAVPPTTAAPAVGPGD